ncbi:hypothetical protein N7490_001594 [Penicillium lividum]|nr:hypothetical protein N7490_001594 [Penicillium lividum]
MRNSEESSITNPLPIRVSEKEAGTARKGLKHRGHLAFMSVTGFPLGRVGAEIVPDNTLVQYAACCSL